MYIYDVLKMCNTLCPNEYTDTEKYNWCDEVSSMIMQEHLKKYDKVTIEPESDGAYLLPEGVTFEMVDRIIDGVKEVDKTDFRSYGIEYYYGQRGRFILPERNRVRGTIDVIYLVQHEPIRNTIITDIESFVDNWFCVKRPALEVGDSLNISMTVTEDGQSKTYKYEGVPVLDIGENPTFELMSVDTEEGTETTVETDDWGTYIVYLPDGTFSDISIEDLIACEIRRIPTEKTVCPAPYDRMYVDYVNAQICYYQRDFDTYNQHMNLFNQRLLAYQSWLQQRRVQDKDGRMINWF